MSPVPVDPAPAVAHTTARAIDVNARVALLYRTLNGADIGLDALNMAPQQAWQAAAFAAGFSGDSLMYMKDALGFVHLRPEIFTASATLATSAILATLPVGYRPGVVSRFITTGSSIGFDISTAGVITAQATGFVITSGNQYSFGLAHFRAEN